MNFHINRLLFSKPFQFFSNNETRQLQQILDVPHSELFDVRINNQFVDLDTRGKRFRNLYQNYYVKMKSVMSKKENENININKEVSREIHLYTENWITNQCRTTVTSGYMEDLIKFFTHFENEATITMHNLSYLDELQTKVEIVEMKKIEQSINKMPSFYSIDLLLNPSKWETEERVSTFSFFQLISNIGGTLGIWTGSSIVSLIHLVFTLSCWLHKTFAKRHPITYLL